MDIRRALETEHSKNQTERIVHYIGNDALRFRELMLLFMNAEPVISQRAAWAFGYIGETQPQLIQNYFPQLLELLVNPGVHPAIPRNILRSFESIDIPEIYQSQLLDCCMKFINSELQPVAVRAFAITVAANISKHYPELSAELKLLLEDLKRLPQSPAIKSRIKQAEKILAR